MTRTITRLFWRSLRRSLDAIARDKRGGIAVFLATAIVPLVGFLGLAVDTTRGYLLKSRLNQALDAAALAGGRVIFSANRDADVRMYFNANFPPGYMGATVTGPTIAPSADNQKLTLAASAVVDTTFLRVLGIDNVTVRSEVEVTRQEQLLDVMLAIDVSLSMNEDAGSGQTRIQAARSAANTLVGILFGDDETKNLLKIGLVPWNSKVNVKRSSGISIPKAPKPVNFTNPVTGQSQTQVYYSDYSPVPLLSAPPANWKGCVYNRYTVNNANNDADIYEGLVTVGGAQWFGWQPVGAEGEPTTSNNSHCQAAEDADEPRSKDCTPCSAYGITALQNTKTTITTAINALQASGSTNLPAGLQWAWSALTPGEPWEEADPNPPFRRQQAIVLLTDGENTGDYGDGYKNVFNNPKTSMDARSRLLAQNVKASGVVIYVIQFANNSSSMQTLLKQVATGPDKPYYNYAPNAATLQQVFKEVANNLSELRLSK
jgi:Flp pilus assembly protein TadG